VKPQEQGAVGVPERSKRQVEVEETWEYAEHPSTARYYTPLSSFAVVVAVLAAASPRRDSQAGEALPVHDAAVVAAAGLGSTTLPLLRVCVDLEAARRVVLSG
jgi:hypothetical protein